MSTFNEVELLNIRKSAIISDIRILIKLFYYDDSMTCHKQGFEPAIASLNNALSKACGTTDVILKISDPYYNAVGSFLRVVPHIKNFGVLDAWLAEFKKYARFTNL